MRLDGRKSDWRLHGVLTVIWGGLLLLPMLAQSVPRGEEMARASGDNLPSRPVPTSVRSAADAITPEYTLGEGDILRINVWKEPEISQNNIAVQPDGMISVPLVGLVRVSSMTVSQVEATLTAKLKRFIDRPQVTVIVVEVRSKSVYLTGEVVKPGVYPLFSSTNVAQVVIRAGGLTPFARRNSVVVLRTTNGVQERFKVNLSKVLRGEAPEQNIELLPSDIVVVP